jgi:hypothetical protein
MRGAIYSANRDTSGSITIRDSGLESGDWFILTYPHSPPVTIYLSANESAADGFLGTSRTYILKGGLLGSNSAWHVYYYKDPITQTNNLYLY